MPFVRALALGAVVAAPAPIIAVGIDRHCLAQRQHLATSSGSRGNAINKLHSNGIDLAPIRLGEPSSAVGDATTPYWRTLLTASAELKNKITIDGKVLARA
jgi:hypothetical protein